MNDQQLGSHRSRCSDGASVVFDYQRPNLNGAVTNNWWGKLSAQVAQDIASRLGTPRDAPACHVFSKISEC
jgi:hypothetical protein